jgi:hypothetical protein
MIEFSPIELEPNTKNVLEGILNSGGTRFPINSIFDEISTNYSNSCSLLITNEFIRIVTLQND